MLPGYIKKKVRCAAILRCQNMSIEKVLQTQNKSMSRRWCLFLAAVTISVGMNAQQGGKLARLPGVGESAAAVTNQTACDGQRQEDCFRIRISKTPVVLQPIADVRTLHLRGAIADVLQDSFQAYDIQVIYRSAPESRSIRVDLGDADFATAEHLLELLTHYFFVPQNEKQVLALPDTRENRETYSDWQAETIALPTLAEDQRESLENLLKNDLNANKPVLKAGSLTLQGNPRTLEQVHSLVKVILAPRPQILLDVKVYVLDKSHYRDVGMTIPQQTTVFNVPGEATSLISQNQATVDELISEGVVTAGDTTAIAAALVLLGDAANSVLSNSFFEFGKGISLTGVTMSSVTATLSLTASEAKQLKDVTLHLDDQQQAKILLGSRYPIKTSSYTATTSSTASSSTSTSIVPQIQYEDLGLTLEVKPHILRSDDVFLHLHLKMEGLSGTTLNSMPVLQNQELTSDLTVRNSWSTIIMTSASKQQARATTAFPGMVPTDKSSDVDSEEIVVVLTPRLTRSSNAETAGEARPLPPVKQ